MEAPHAGFWHLKCAALRSQVQAQVHAEASVGGGAQALEREGGVGKVAAWQRQVGAPRGFASRALELWDAGAGARDHALHADERVNVLGVEVPDGLALLQVEHAHLSAHAHAHTSQRGEGVRHRHATSAPRIRRLPLPQRRYGAGGVRVPWLTVM